MALLGLLWGSGVICKAVLYAKPSLHVEPLFCSASAAIYAAGILRPCSMALLHAHD